MTLENKKLAEVKAENPTWFDPSNRRMFGDVRYTVKYGKSTGNPYLIRSTYAWTDMFGEKPTLHYRINPINDDLSIGNLIDDVFPTLDAAYALVKSH